ncbi:MAG: flavodoxin family protein [Elusimicrobiaceae bacterium]|nr:flavodoxin family protein [Elusimicrobiaceae bacterium]
MKVLLVNGSPHQKGCTYTALSEVAKTLNENNIETEIFWLGVKPISGCIACNGCDKTGGRCVLGGIVNEFLDKCDSADGFIFGSPVHWAGGTGAITSFMDRIFYAGSRDSKQLFLLKPAAVVTSARRSGTTATWDQLNKYFALMQMPIIPSRYWNNVHGYTPEQVLQDLEGMQQMRYLGRNMAWFLRCKEAAAKAGVPIPEQEPVVFTNFIR